ncbi:hypothetical protein TanjilG_24031 [Lupinus angustifolius]|uniref:Fe2OG dioxygenase domain-containing protein n=1 Tax=Lupinus angustifolius TaxID=3871 RepID=A0A1J7GQ88_LUPAN|nr:PREDICTED: gibberellin 2-beta-dioxygenase 8-like [Lupinus angustifolius]OIW02580.1 hypothetical protein TanjilG_24031 [Lupinus angustifolius]
MNNLESFPPHFRNLSHHQPPSPAPEDGGNPTKYLESLPIIDLENLSNDKNKVEEACKNWGLFRLVNHGIPSSLLSQLHEQTKQVFFLSYESKHASCDGSNVNYFCGSTALTPSGTTIPTERHNTNFFEGFGIPSDQLSKFHPQLPDLESFRVLLVEYEKHMSRIATTLFERFVKNLELEMEESKYNLEDKTGLFRVYRYLHCSDPDGGLGLAVHTDSSVLTILNQEDEVSGLEVLRDHQWLTVKPISNTLIVNIGDLMQAISDDKYKSALHRVKVDKHKDRVSIAYFMYSGEGVKVESSKYRSFTANQYLAQVQQDIETIGHKIGLSRFKRNEDN